MLKLTLLIGHTSAALEEVQHLLEHCIKIHIPPCPCWSVGSGVLAAAYETLLAFLHTAFARQRQVWSQSDINLTGSAPKRRVKCVFIIFYGWKRRQYDERSPRDWSCSA
jgi:hypothetical protein